MALMQSAGKGASLSRLDATKYLAQAAAREKIYR